MRDLRIRWIGHTLRAEADITVNPALTVSQAHDLAHHAERHLLSDVRRLTAATIHVSPTGAHPPRLKPYTWSQPGRQGGPVRARTEAAPVPALRHQGQHHASALAAPGSAFRFAAACRLCL